MAAERFRSFPDLPRFPLGDGVELVYDPLGRAARALPTTAVHLLLGCTPLASLDEHAGRLCAQLNLGPWQQAAVRAQLDDLARTGLLVSETHLLDARQASAADPEPPAQITTLGVPTRNRPASLEACLRSFLEAGRRHGRLASYVVVDDSDQPETREANQGVLRSLRDAFGAEIACAGPEEKVCFARALAREADLPEETVRFAFVKEGYPIATGGNRNALLLHTAGEAFLQVDDDIFCRLAPTPDTRAGLALSSRPDPTAFWFLPESAPEPAAGLFTEDDLPALHEQLLGKRPGDCLGVAGGVVDLEQASAGFFRRLGRVGSRVLVTMAGVVGDSGMGSSLHLLTLEGAGRARLLASERDYRHAVAHRRVLRAVTRATVSDAPFCMAGNLGLDNRRLLPPFLPVQRNQDGVFAVLLRCCQGGGFFGFLPWAILHQPPSPRSPAADPWRDVGRVQTGHLFQVLIGAVAPRVDGVDARTSLVALGRALADLADLAPASFEEVARLQLWQALSGWAGRLEARLRASGGQPAYWADDVRRAVTTLREALTDPDFAVPWDLREAFGAAAGRERARRLVGQFGRLLQAWPALIDAARALRARGVRLATAV